MLWKRSARAPKSASDVLPRCVTVLDRGEAVVLHTQTGHYYGMNDTATFLWESFSQGLDAATIARLYCERYGVEPETAQADVRSFRIELERRGLPG